MAREQSGQQAAAAGVRVPGRKLKLGLVGCGEVTQIVHWPSLYQLADHFEVTALCDVSSLVLEELGRLWNVRNLTTDYRVLVSSADVDAVLVANPNAFHAEVTLAAIAAGKHVLVEKPMCITRREAEQVNLARKERGVVVQVGYMRRYAPAFLDACNAVQELAQINYARVRAFIGSNALIVNPTSRVIREAPLPEARKREAKDREEALLNEALGGNPTETLKQAYSLMLGLSSHDLSAMRELLGMPERVLFATQRSAAAVEGGIGIYLTADFDYGAYVCHFETGIDRIPRFDAHLEVYGRDKVLRVQYDTPYVRNLPIRMVVTETNGRGGVVRQDSHPVWGDPFVAEWLAFHDNVTRGKEPKTGPADFALDLELFAAMAGFMHQA